MSDVLLKWANRDDYTVEVHTSYTHDFIEYVVELYRPYSEGDNLKAENYTPERIRNCFRQKFEYGFYIVKFKGQIILTFGVDNFEGWAVVTRYLRHGDKSLFILPLAHGIGVPFVIKHLGDRVKGVCSTQNKDSKDLMGAVARRYAKFVDDDNMFGDAAKVSRDLNKLPYTVNYRGVEQVVYVYHSKKQADIPPFRKYTA